MRKWDFESDTPTMMRWDEVKKTSDLETGVGSLS